MGGFKALSLPFLPWVLSLCYPALDPLRNPVLISMALRLGWFYCVGLCFFKIHILYSEYIDFIIIN